MDIQACVQLVNEYHPGEEVPPALHETIERITAALADSTPIAASPPLADGLRPLVKALATVAPHLPERWNDILRVLRSVLESSNLPWLHRAFVLKTLPSMLIDAPTTHQREHGAALCELLVHWSMAPPSSPSNTDACGAVDAREESMERPNPQERRVALTALLSLPQEYADSIVQQLIAKLPQSVTTCVALLSNPSAHEELKKKFEAWLCSPSASLHASCAAEIENKLKEHFSGYGAAKCEKCCASLISREKLKTLDDLQAFQVDVRALEGIEALHHNVIKSRLSLAFLLAKATEVVDLVYPHQDGQREEQHPHLTISLEESILPLSVLRSLVQLTDFASVTPDSVSTTEIRRLALSFLTIDSTDAALDAPLPLLECVFHLLLRSLPCVPESDEGMLSLLQEIFRVSELLPSVMDNAALKIQSAIPLFRENQQRQEKSNDQTGKEIVAGEDQEQLAKSIETRRQSTIAALRTAQRVAQLCRICKKKCPIQTEQRHQEEMEKAEEEGEKGLHLKTIAEGLALAARGVPPSWTKERKRVPRPDGASAQPHYPRRGDRNVGNHPFKRRRRDAPPM